MDLANQLTKPRGEGLFSAKPLELAFSFSDVSGGSLVIGTCRSGKIVLKTAVEISVRFDGGVTLTVGDGAAQGRLVIGSDVNTDKIGTYDIDSNYKYEVETELRMYFPSGSPTQGMGRLVIYLA